MAWQKLQLPKLQLPKLSESVPDTSDSDLISFLSVFVGGEGVYSRIRQSPFVMMA
jgi:hypothetical protein